MIVFIVKLNKFDNEFFVTKMLNKYNEICTKMYNYEYNNKSFTYYMQLCSKYYNIKK